MDYELIRKRLEEELFKRVENEIHSGERELYESKLVEWEARYKAARSIKGMKLTGALVKVRGGGEGSKIANSTLTAWYDYANKALEPLQCQLQPPMSSQ